MLQEKAKPAENQGFSIPSEDFWIIPGIDAGVDADGTEQGRLTANRDTENDRIAEAVW